MNNFIEKEVTVSETLSKRVMLDTEDYIINNHGKNEDGADDIEIDFSAVNWKWEYDRNHYDLESLLTAVGTFLTTILDDLDDIDKCRAKDLIQECEGWVQDEFEAVI